MVVTQKEFINQVTVEHVIKTVRRSGTSQMGGVIVVQLANIDLQAETKICSYLIYSFLVDTHYQ